MYKTNYELIKFVNNIKNKIKKNLKMKIIIIIKKTTILSLHILVLSRLYSLYFISPLLVFFFLSYIKLIQFVRIP